MVSNVISNAATIVGGLMTIIAFIKFLILPVRNFIKKSNENDEELTKAIHTLAQKVDDNERDRIRSEIFRYGSIARRKGVISAEEMASIRIDFDKYTTELKGNGIAHKEFDYVDSYYNSQF